MKQKEQKNTGKQTGGSLYIAYNDKIRMLFSHLMQSEIIIYGLVRKCVKLSPFS